MSLGHDSTGTEQQGLEDWSIAALEHLGTTVNAEGEYSAKDLAYAVAGRLGQEPEKVRPQRAGTTLRRFLMPNERAKRKKDGYCYRLDPAWVRGLLERYGIAVPDDEAEEDDDLDDSEFYNSSEGL